MLQPEIKTFPAHKISDRTFSITLSVPFGKICNSSSCLEGQLVPEILAVLKTLVRLHRFNRHLFLNFQEFSEKELFYWVPVLSSARHEERL